MKIADKPGLSLIAECEKVKFHVRVLDNTHDESIEGGTVRIGDVFYPIDEIDEVQYRVVHSFELTLDGLSQPDQYKEAISKMLKYFFDEINELVISSDIPHSQKLNSVMDYKFHFESLIGQFALIHSPVSSNSYVSSKNVIIEHSDERPISDLELIMHISEFLTHQKEVLGKAILFLDTKLEILEKTSNSGHIMNEQKSRNRKLPAIEKYDRYEIGLIFHYLTEAGVIHRLSANTLASILSELTGHSAQTLRADCLDVANAIDIIKGTKGNKHQLVKNPSHYINSIENLLLDLFKRVREDKAKYWKDKENCNPL